MDYEYLRMLEDRIAILSDSPAHAAVVQRATRLLQSLPASLLTQVEDRFGQRHYLDWHNASLFAEETRRKVLAMLVDLPSGNIE